MKAILVQDDRSLIWADVPDPVIKPDEVLVKVEYRTDGSSLNMFRQYIKNPQGFAFIRKVSMQLSPTAKRRFMEATHYVSSSLILKNRNFL